MMFFLDLMIIHIKCYYPHRRICYYSSCLTNDNIFLFLKVSYAEGWAVYSYEKKTSRGDSLKSNFIWIHLFIPFSHLMIFVYMSSFRLASYYVIPFLSAFYHATVLSFDTFISLITYYILRFCYRDMISASL